jgi:hypothetical protein
MPAQKRCKDDGGRMAATNIDIAVVPGLRAFQEGFVMISRSISAFRRSSSARRNFLNQLLLGDLPPVSAINSL